MDPGSSSLVGRRYVRLETLPFGISQIGSVAPFHSQERTSQIRPTRFFKQFLRVSLIIGRRLPQHHNFTATSHGIEAKSPAPTPRRATFRTHPRFAKLALRAAPTAKRCNRRTKTGDTGWLGLKLSSHQYRAWVGPPEDYDLIASIQVSLLLSCRLREAHRLLDVGCGSFRVRLRPGPERLLAHLSRLGPDRSH
jgi:hypothetical protein